MAKYLLHGSYTVEGLKGVLREGGSKRREAVAQLVKGLGGSLEMFYFAFGGDDFYVVIDAPDNVSAAAAALVVNASGAVTLSTQVLLTPEEVDQATHITVNYRPPGQ